MRDAKRTETARNRQRACVIPEDISSRSKWRLNRFAVFDRKWNNSRENSKRSMLLLLLLSSSCISYEQHSSRFGIVLFPSSNLVGIACKIHRGIHRAACTLQNAYHATVVRCYTLVYKRWLWSNDQANQELNLSRLIQLREIWAGLFSLRPVIIVNNNAMQGTMVQRWRNINRANRFVLQVDVRQVRNRQFWCRSSNFLASFCPWWESLSVIIGWIMNHEKRYHSVFKLSF